MNSFLKVKYFIHGLSIQDGRLDGVNVLSTDENSQLILHKFDMWEHSRSVKFSTERVYFPTFGWEGTLDLTARKVRRLEDVKDSLDAEESFGVWGQKQYALFKRVLPNLVDVSSEFEDVSILDRDTPEPPFTIGDVFLTLLKKGYEKHPHESKRGAGTSFQSWVETVAWLELLFVTKDDVDVEDDSDELEYLDHEGMSERLKKLTRDTDLKSRKW